VRIEGFLLRKNLHVIIEKADNRSIKQEVHPWMMI